MTELTDVTLRIATPDDAADILSVYKPYVTDTAVTFELVVPSVEEFAGRIESVLRRYPYIVAVSEGEVIGFTYAGPFRTRAAYNWAVETSIYVKMDERRKGIGRTLYKALEFALDAQGILNLVACIAYPQMPDEYLTRNSAVFHERMGYQLVGEFHECGYKFNRWYDMVWMEKRIGAHLTDQVPVKDFDEVRPYVESLLA